MDYSKNITDPLTLNPIGYYWEKIPNGEDNEYTIGYRAYCENGSFYGYGEFFTIKDINTLKFLSLEFTIR